MPVTLSDYHEASAVPITVPICQEPKETPVLAWRATGLTYHSGPVYQCLNDGHLAYEVDGSRLVQLPEDVEEAFLALILDGLLADDGVN